MPTVSIILTSLNHAPFLREAINSVLNQSFSDFELIILDDASTDDSWRIIHEYSDERIRTFRSDHPGMAVKKVNEAIFQTAKGKYIAIHHSDDKWHPEKLEKQIAFLDNHPDTGAVFTHVQVINEQGKPFNMPGHFYHQVFDQPNRTRHEWLRFFLEHGNALCHPSVLIRKSCYLDFGPYKYGLLQVPDLDMWMRLCLHYPIHIIQEKLTCFRVRNNEQNTSGSKRETYVRFTFETYHLLDNFRKIHDTAKLYAIFPEFEEIYAGKKTHPQFIFAMLCIEKNFYGVGVLYGLNLLFELLQNESDRKWLWEEYGFENQTYTQLTENDVLLRVTTNELQTQLHELQSQHNRMNAGFNKLDKQFNELNAQFDKCKEELAAVYASRSWQITSPFRWLKHIATSIMSRS
ncbi:MAG: glycosyltransferase [Betaproteobacteria bacterium]|nr:glycosyltransferase [Betaproteobacteria bacterium]